MNGRSNQYRLHHWQLAERQRHLDELESLVERLRADSERLRAEIDEAGGAAAVPKNGRIDPLFIRPLLERRDKLLGSIAEVEERIGEARAAVAASQQEMKLVEGAFAVRSLKFEERMTRRSRRSM
jgi:DNA repair exonuclease SbcCD ATPase subunit